MYKAQKYIWIFITPSAAFQIIIFVEKIKADWTKT